MQFKKAIATFLSTIVLFSIAWMVLLFSQGILESNENKNVAYVPSNALFAVRIDGRELADKTLFSVFLESKDEEILTMIQEAFSENKSSEKKWIKDGVDYLSDIVFFQIKHESISLNCILLNVSNESLFKKHHTNELEICAVNNGVGVIITKNSAVNITGLQALASKIVYSPQNGDLSSSIDHPQAGRFIEAVIHSKKKDKSTFSFELAHNSLLMNGEMEFSSSKNLDPIHKKLQPKGLHISTSLIPTELSDTLNTWLKQFGVKVPAFKELSMNYMSTTVINHSSGFFIVPQMELYVECVSPFSINTLTESDTIASFLDCKMNEGWIEIQDEKLYYKQLSPSSFYIGVSENPVFTSVQKNNYLIVSGTLSPLTSIKCGGLMSTILEMIPEYRAGKTFANRAEKIDFSIVKLNAQKAKISGDIHFKSGYFPMNEVLKLLITGKTLN
jgi:hypothetical protein